MNEAFAKPSTHIKTTSTGRKWEERNNSGVLFYLDSKKTEKHPDLTGKLRVGGKAYHISGWVKKSESGADYISLSVNSELLSH